MLGPLTGLCLDGTKIERKDLKKIGSKSPCGTVSTLNPPGITRVTTAQEAVIHGCRAGSSNHCPIHFTKCFFKHGQFETWEISFEKNKIDSNSPIIERSPISKTASVGRRPCSICKRCSINRTFPEKKMLSPRECPVHDDELGIFSVARPFFSVKTKIQHAEARKVLSGFWPSGCGSPPDPRGCRHHQSVFWFGSDFD